MRLNIKTLEKSVKKRFRSKKAENNPIKAIMIEKKFFCFARGINDSFGGYLL